jgi:glycosyltransferase involved in cell wall biosynthesis
MRICYLANAESIHTQRWVEYFANRGHEVHLISRKTFGNNNNNNIKNVNLHLINRLKLQIRIISYPIDILYNIFQIKKLIRQIKPDILHVHYISDLAVLGALTGFHPYVASVWGSDVLRNPKKSKIMKYRVSYVLIKADIILTIPEFMKKYLVNMYNLPGNKIVRIPWGIDLNIFHSGYENETLRMKEKIGIKINSPVILSNRGMAPQYQIEKIIKAIPYIIKTFPDTIFIFIKGYGLSEFEEKMKLLTEKLNISNNTYFISKILTPEEMVIYLNMANVLISIPETDQFSSSIMEGMACGVIPIISNIKVYEQYLKNEINAFVVNPNNPKDIAEKINHCIKHPEIQNKFYNINKKIIEENENWDENSKKMMMLYKNLLE